MEKEIFRIPTPHEFVFDNNYIQKDPSREVFQEVEKQALFTITGVEYPDEGGIFVHYKELLHPRKGFPYPEAVHAVNFAKRQIASWIRFFSEKWLILPYLAFVILPKRAKIKIIARFIKSLADCVEPTLYPKYLKEKYYTAPAKEIAHWTWLFLTNLGIPGGVADSFLRIVRMIIEYDTAYCWRIQDTLSEVDKEKLISSPRREIDRLLKISLSRDNSSNKVKEQFTAISYILKAIMFIPSINKAFIRSVREVDFNKISLTEADKYQLLFYKDYDFMGLTREQKIEKLEALHNGVIPTGPFKVKLNE